MQWDWTISVGNIITMALFFFGGVSVVWKFYGSFTAKTTAFENLLKAHADTLISHAMRMEKQDELLLRIIGDVQRLVGRMESARSIDMKAAAMEAARVIERAATAAERVIAAAEKTADKALERLGKQHGLDA